MKAIKIFIIMCIVLLSINIMAQNVGIGTNTPSKKLEINSGALNQSGLRLTQYANSTTEVNVTDVFADVLSVTGLAFDNIGNCYATNFSGNKIQKISPAGIATDFVTTNLNGPHDITFGPDGNLYVSNYIGGTISKITLAGAITTFASDFSNPIGLVFDMNNFLFVVNNGNGQLSKVSPNGASVTYNFGTGLTSPYGCVYNAANDKIYIANYGADEVAEINFLLGGAKATFKSGITACTGINIDATGNLYVAQAAPNKVVKITSLGVVTDYATTTYPFDITFNNGKLYMANQTINKVSVLNAVSNFLAVDNAGDVVRVKAGNLLQTTGQPFPISWTVAGNDIANNNSGSVGIGEPAPSEKLQVNNGNVKIGANAWATAADNKVLKFGDANYVTIGEVGADDKMEVKANEITLKAVSGNVLVPDGNVAIGTGASTVQNKLQIGNPPGFSGNEIAIGNGTQGMSFSLGTTASIWYSNTNFALMPANGTGNVGIGTTTPAEKLSVNGNIRSKEVVVELANWPDYVFDKKYNLPSLKNVEAYINEYKHLPNIPSAKEIETNGLKVGEVQTKMMQKIEELTLYIIEMKKEIELLKLKNN